MDTEKREEGEGRGREQSQVLLCGRGTLISVDNIHGVFVDTVWCDINCAVCSCWKPIRVSMVTTGGCSIGAGRLECLKVHQESRSTRHSHFHHTSTPNLHPSIMSCSFLSFNLEVGSHYKFFIQHFWSFAVVVSNHICVCARVYMYTHLVRVCVWLTATACSRGVRTLTTNVITPSMNFSLVRSQHCSWYCCCEPCRVVCPSIAGKNG